MPRTPWIWLREDVVLALHEQQLAEHGGAAGLRDLGLLQSALARPQNLAAHKKTPDAADLAAAYAFAISRSHPFVDGNKRVALILAELFLALNDHDLAADDVTCVTHILHLAEGSLTEPQFAAWLRTHFTPPPPRRPRA